MHVLRAMSHLRRGEGTSPTTWMRVSTPNFQQQFPHPCARYSPQATFPSFATPAPSGPAPFAVRARSQAARPCGMPGTGPGGARRQRRAAVADVPGASDSNVAPPLPKGQQGRRFLAVDQWPRTATEARRCCPLRATRVKSAPAARPRAGRSCGPARTLAGLGEAQAGRAEVSARAAAMMLTPVTRAGISAAE